MVGIGITLLGRTKDKMPKVGMDDGTQDKDIVNELKTKGEIPAPWRYLHRCVPLLRYWEVHTDYRDGNNYVGDVQRAFCVYWALVTHKRIGGIGLDVGVGQIDPNSYHAIGLDFYAGSNHPSYGGAYWPDIQADGENLPFKDEVFSFIVSNHSIEHMDAKKAFNEWFRVLKPSGIIAFVTPDGKYGPADDDHVKEYTPEVFLDEILSPLINKDHIELIEIDTFKNFFSWNLVVKKKK